MADAGFFRGTSADQDFRFANKQKKLLKELNFSPILNTKLNMSKIDVDSMKPWIEEKIKSILEKDDELLSESIYEHLAAREPVDGKNILVLITGFVEDAKASKFMEELWTKLVELQTTAANQKLEESLALSRQPPEAEEAGSSPVRTSSRRDRSPSGGSRSHHRHHSLDRDRDERHSSRHHRRHHHKRSRRSSSRSSGSRSPEIRERSHDRHRHHRRHRSRHHDDEGQDDGHRKDDGDHHHRHRHHHKKHKKEKKSSHRHDRERDQDRGERDKKPSSNK